MVSIAVVASGTFQYRTGKHSRLLAPGAILLGHPGQAFECAHDHGIGDRCVSFQYTPERFARITGTAPQFRTDRLPPLRATAAIVARACAGLQGAPGMAWEELAVMMAARAATLANDLDVDAQPIAASAIGRVTRAIRSIDRKPDAEHSLENLARVAGLSPYHFLRTFTNLAGITPHQFAMRARLRTAALRLAQTGERIIDVALDSGFGDVSNFNRTFRTEFAATPRAWRAGETRKGPSPQSHSAGFARNQNPTCR